MAEKLAQRRQRKRIPVRYGTDNPVKVAFTDDITREGLFIRTALAIRPGTQVVVELKPPAGTIVLRAEVRWAKQVPSQMLHKLKGGIGLKILAFEQGEHLYRQICDTLYGRED